MRLNLKTRETKIKFKTRLFKAIHRENLFIYLFIISYEEEAK